MAAEILLFRPRNRPGRLQAMRWLAINKISFPGDFELDEGIGPDLFFGWRFIRASDGEVYFADCVHAGVTEDNFGQFIAAHA